MRLQLAFTRSTLAAMGDQVARTTLRLAGAGALSAAMAACSSAPKASPSTPLEVSETPAAEETPPSGGPARSSTPVGTSLSGSAISAWFRDRGAEPPKAVDPEGAECRVIRAPVPSGEALSCEQIAEVDPWARVTRKMLFDVRSGRTLILMNLVSRVAPVQAAASGASSSCDGAVLVLRVELSSDGQTLEVDDETGCGCEGRAESLAKQAEEARDEGKMRDAQAFDYQAREVKTACAEVGVYEWEDQGFVPADG